MTVNKTTKKLKCIVLGGAGAGKTSILRRYFHNTFDINRTPTVGSDFYAKRINLEEEEEEENQENEVEKEVGEEEEEEKKETTSPSTSFFKSSSSPMHHHRQHSNNNINTSNTNNNTISIQVWDTPGRERYAIDRSDNKKENQNNVSSAAFSDRFFQNADVALLVYDITSSTSFTHVLKWHADLMSRAAAASASASSSNNNNGGDKTHHRRKNKPPTSFPILIVANKIDIWKNRIAEKQKSQQSTGIVKKRDVMGLSGKDFKGKDLRYEYSASPPSSKRLTSSSHIISNSSSSINNNNKSHASRGGGTGGSSKGEKKKNGRFEISTYMGTGDQTSYLEAVLSNQVARGTYLESLLTTEDGSYPDGDLVMLWCMRNGLKHFEVSALDGTGVDKLMNEMVHIALEAEKQQQKEEEEEERKTTSSSSASPHYNYDDIEKITRNDELDLHRRYTPGPRSWLSLPFNGCCKPK